MKNLSLIGKNPIIFHPAQLSGQGTSVYIEKIGQFVSTEGQSYPAILRKLLALEVDLDLVPQPLLPHNPQFLTEENRLVGKIPQEVRGYTGSVRAGWRLDIHQGSEIQKQYLTVCKGVKLHRTGTLFRAGKLHAKYFSLRDVVNINLIPVFIVKYQLNDSGKYNTRHPALVAYIYNDSAFGEPLFTCPKAAQNIGVFLFRDAVKKTAHAKYGINFFHDGMVAAATDILSLLI